jgi:hypothetical protein
VIEEMGEKKSASLERAISGGVQRGDFGILRNEIGGFVFEKREEKTLAKPPSRKENDDHVQ